MSRYAIEHVDPDGHRVSIDADVFLDEIRREAIAGAIRDIEGMILSPNEEDGVAAVLNLLKGAG